MLQELYETFLHPKSGEILGSDRGELCWTSKNRRSKQERYEGV